MKIHFFCRLYNTGWRKTDLDNEELALVGLGVKRAMYTPVNIKWGPGVQHFATLKRKNFLSVLARGFLINFLTFFVDSYQFLVRNGWLSLTNY